MKKNLLIICFLSIAGIHAQEVLFVPQIEHNTVINETEPLQTNTVLRVDNVTYSMKEYESMIKRGKELTFILIEHDKLVQKGSMSKKQIKKWKRDVLEAKLLNYRIDDYTSAYLREGYSLIDHVSEDVLSDYYDFSKVLETSVQYVGF
ncbi:hypothetical protein [Aquimarina sp. 2304DJ70-9]|uniref:hypothetical protein n=1 Tax=Aquimarina penaris TaxID=3231044 RepID=UPI00346362F5